MDTDLPDEVSDDIAEELAAEQRSISVAEFFEKNKHMLGFDSAARGLVTAVKEGVDNALDACEEAGVLPDIFVEIEDIGDTYEVVIEDNGPGIVREQIPKIFGQLLYGSRFGKRVQSRGQQGIGISAAVLYSQLTSGKPVTITSRTKGGDAHRFEVVIDTDENDPEILEDEVVDWDRPRGTRIEMEMEANMRARSQLHEYVKHTAVVNPHARIHLDEPGAAFTFERATDELPKEAEEIEPHPHGTELGTLMRLLVDTESHSVTGFLGTEFTRVGQKTAQSIEDRFVDRLYGREAAWRVDGVDSDDVADGIGADGGTVQGVLDALQDAHGVRVSWSQIAEVVEDEGADDEVAEAVWSAARASRGDVIRRQIDEATGDRKDGDALDEFAERLAARFDDGEGRDRRTRAELTTMVARAANGVEEVREATIGETARENVVAAVWSGMRRVPDDPPTVKDIAGDRDACRDLLEAMRATDVMAPPTDCLSPITPELLEAGLKKEFDADFYAAATRDADVHEGDPFLVEAGVAYGGALEAESQAKLMRFANRVPLVYQQGACVTSEALQQIGWKNYGLDGKKGAFPAGPAVIMIHVASTNVPFTSESKDAVASVPAIRDEVERAVRDVMRELKSFINKRETREKRREKQRVIQNLVPQMAEKVASMTGREEPPLDATMARILNKVSVEREVEGDTATIRVENNDTRKHSLEIHTFVGGEPAVENGDGDVDVVDMDGEFDLKWDVDVGKGAEATLEYRFDGEPGSLSVKGVEDDVVEVTT